MVMSSYEWKIVEMDKNIKQMNNQLLLYNNTFAWSYKVIILCTLFTQQDQGQIQMSILKKELL